MKKIPILFLGLLGGLAACTRIPPAIAPDKKIETRIGELLQKMTLEEKIGQMCQLTAGVVIASAIAEIGAQGLRDMGKVMAVLKERHPGQMDFARASGVVKDLLK